MIDSAKDPRVRSRPNFPPFGIEAGASFQGMSATPQTELAEFLSREAKINTSTAESENTGC